MGTRMAPPRHRHAGGGGGPRESTESVHPPEADMPSNAGYFTDGVQKSLEFCFVASPKNGSKFSATNPSQLPPH